MMNRLANIKVLKLLFHCSCGSLDSKFIVHQ